MGDVKATICTGTCGRLVVLARQDGRTIPPGHVWHRGRGMCGGCYGTTSKHGTREDRPRRTWSRDDLLDTYGILRDQERDVEWPIQRIRRIAPRMGLRPESLLRALERARAAGDRRAVTW